MFRLITKGSRTNHNCVFTFEKLWLLKSLHCFDLSCRTSISKAETCLDLLAAFSQYRHVTRSSVYSLRCDQSLNFQIENLKVSFFTFWLRKCSKFLYVLIPHIFTSLQKQKFLENSMFKPPKSSHFHGAKMLMTFSIE